MEQHESKILTPGSNYKRRTNHYSLIDKVEKNEMCYVDSNYYLHNLIGPSYIIKLNGRNLKSYYIHGDFYTKEEFDIKRNRILMLNEI